MLESKMTSTFQAWLTRKVVATQREISKSAGRACRGRGGEEVNFNLPVRSWTRHCTVRGKMSGRQAVMSSQPGNAINTAGRSTGN